MDAYRFWANLDEARKSNQSSLKEVCRKLGIAYQRIADQRSECRLPKLEDAFLLASDLGVSLEYLLTGTEQTTIYPERIKAIADACMHEATEEDLVLVERILRITPKHEEKKAATSGGALA